MDDKLGSGKRKSRDGASGLPIDELGQERFTISTLEHKLRHENPGSDFSTARSRKHRRKEESGSGVLLWLVIAAVVFAYLGLLSYNILKGRLSRSRIQPATAVTPPPPVEPGNVATGDTPQAESPVAAASEAEASVAPPAVPVLEIITALRRAQALSDEGQRFIRNRQFAQADMKLTEAAALAPSVYSILMDLAKVQRELKKLEACRDVLIRAISVEPDSVETRIMLAQVYYDLRQNDDALAMAKWALESEPYSEEANQIAAEIYTVLERYDLAVNHWQKIAALNSGNTTAKNNLGAAQYQMGQLSQAITTFEGVLKLDPGNPQAHYYLSLCLIKKNEPELAVDVLSRATAKLGQQFVQAWTRSPDYDPVRELPTFKLLFPDIAPIAITPTEID